MRTHTYAHIYVYTNIHIYTYMCVYIYTYIPNPKFFLFHPVHSRFVATLKQPYLLLKANRVLCALGWPRVSPWVEFSDWLLSSYTHFHTFSRRSHTLHGPSYTDRPLWSLAASPQRITCTPIHPRRAGRLCGRRGLLHAGNTPGSSYICPERSHRDSWGSGTSSHRTGRCTCQSERLRWFRAQRETQPQI